MKTLFYTLSLLSVVVGLSAIAPASAQDSSNSDLPGGRQAFSSLSAHDKLKLFKARRTVLDQNPDLKAEQDKLMQQRQTLQSQNGQASPADRQVFIRSFLAHEKKMQQAMLKVDPSLAPVFQQIDQDAKAKLQQHAAGQNGGN